MKVRDEPAFEELVARHTGLVLSIAMRVLRSRAEAEEVAQETFWRIFRKIDSFDLSRPFVPWLYKITLNLAYTRLKQRRQQQALSIDELQPRFDDMGMQVPDELTTVIDLDEQLATQEAAQRAEEIIAELPEKYGTVLWMHDVAGISASTLTTVLDLSLPAFKSRLHRGRLAVRKRLLESLAPKRVGAPPPQPPMPMAMGQSMGITCRDVVESLLIDYLEGQLSPGDREQFERHLRGCDRCGPFVESYRKLVSSLSKLSEPAIPAEMVQATLSFVRSSLESGQYLNRNWAEGLRAVFGQPLRRLFRRRP
ncbi:MAG: sigma-70 family RNA polymerase sigma factor [Thermoanaerobaculia bacterium]